MAIDNSVSKDFDLRSSIVLTFSIAAYPVCYLVKFIRLYATVLAAKSESDVMPCLQSYQGLKIDKSLVY